MKAFSPLIFSLFLLLIMSCVSATTLEEICGKLSQGKDHIDFNFCLTSLQADHKSRKADIQGLAVIAVKLAKTNVTHNIGKASELLKSKDVSGRVKIVLETCVEVYDLSVDEFSNAIAYIRSRDYKNAMNQLSAAYTSVTTCIDTWQEQSKTSPMAKEEGDASELSHLSIKLVALL